MSWIFPVFAGVVEWTMAEIERRMGTGACSCDDDDKVETTDRAGNFRARSFRLLTWYLLHVTMLTISMITITNGITMINIFNHNLCFESNRIVWIFEKSFFQNDIQN